MDKTVPYKAARLLDFIGDVETGRETPAAYNVIFGHNEKHLSKPITQLTIDQLIDKQSGFTRQFGSSASGRYQFMRATLLDLKRELKLGGHQVFDANLQDRLGYHLLRRRGYDDWAAGGLSDTNFALRLAMEWASLPVLAATKGQHRHISRGQSYYAGDGLNKSLVSPERVEVLLKDVRADNRVPKPRPEPEPPEPTGSWMSRLLAGIARLFGGSKMAIASQAGDTVNVEVKSAASSKINWTQVVGVLASVGVAFGIDVPADTQVMIVLGIQAAQAAATWVFRTWFTKTVTPASTG